MGTGVAPDRRSRSTPARRLEESEVRLGAPALVTQHLELHVVTHDGSQLGQEVVRREAREQAPVELDRRLRRHDVHLVAGAHDRRVDRVAQHRLELRVRRPRGPAPASSVNVGWSSPRSGARAGAGSSAAMPLDHPPRDVGRVDRQAPAVERAQQTGQPRVSAAHGNRAVAAGAADRRPRPADLLLGDLDRVEAPAGDVRREAAELADPVADALEQLGVALDEEARPRDRRPPPRRTSSAEHEVPRRPRPGGGQRQQERRPSSPRRPSCPARHAPR